MKPTPNRIAKEIKALREIKPKVAKTNFFGDDNHEKIDAQIRVLEEEMDEDRVIEAFEDVTDPEASIEVVSSARDAADWMCGESKEPPSKGWKELVPKLKNSC